MADDRAMHFSGWTGLEARGLICLRGGRMVFQALDFGLAPGELLILTGPNGCGKTSLLRMIAGFLPAAGGRLGLAGGGGLPAPDLVHYAGHELAIKTALGVADNLAFWRDWTGGGPQEMATAVEVFDLAPLLALRTGSLSQGQRKRLSLARLLLAERPLWLLDEPNVAIDAAAGKRLDTALNRHLGRGGSAVIATHQPLGAMGRKLDLSAFAPQRPEADEGREFAA